MSAAPGLSFVLSVLIAVAAASCSFAGASARPLLTLGEKNNWLVPSGIIMTPSPDGRTLAVATYGKQVYLLDAASLKVLGTFNASDGMPRLRWRSNRQLVSAGEHGGLMQWNLGAKISSRVIREGFGDVSGLAVSPDGTHAALTVFGGSVTVVGLDSGAVVASIRPGPVYDDAAYRLEYSPDGTRLLWSDWLGRVTLWDLQRGTAAWTTSVQDGAEQLLSVGVAGPHYSSPDHVSQLAFSVDGRWIVADGPNGTLTVLDASNGAIAWSGGPAGTTINSLAIMPDGRSVLVGYGDGTIRRVAIRDGRVLFSRRSAQRIDGIAVERQGAVFRTLEMGGFIGVYDAETGRPARPAMVRTVTRAAFSEDGSLLAAGGSDGVIEMYSMPSGRLFGRIEADTELVSNIAFSPDGTMLASSSADRLSAWDVRSGSSVWRAGADYLYVDGAAFLPGGILVSGEGGSLTLRDGRTGAELAALHAPGCDSIQSLAVSLDGRSAATGCLEGPVFVWSLEERRILFHRPEPVERYEWTTPVAFSRDGRRLLCVDDHRQEITWLSIPDGGLESRIDARAEGALREVMLLPRGDAIAVSRDDRVLEHWTLELLEPQGRARTLYSALEGVGNIVAASPDGRTLVTSGNDGRLRVWATRAPPRRVRKASK